jgi:hypothetical protein
MAYPLPGVAFMRCSGTTVRGLIAGILAPMPRLPHFAHKGEAWIAKSE